jgi:hypothetical protein
MGRGVCIVIVSLVGIYEDLEHIFLGILYVCIISPLLSSLIPILFHFFLLPFSISFSLPDLAQARLGHADIQHLTSAGAGRGDATGKTDRMGSTRILDGLGDEGKVCTYNSTVLSYSITAVVVIGT